MWVVFEPAPWVGIVGLHQPRTVMVTKRVAAILPPGQWDPPLEGVPGKGWPRICLEAEGIVLEFVSTAEMLEMADVLDRPVLDPATSNRRWYRKLPASLKSKHGRTRTAHLLRRAASAYARQLPAIARTPSLLPDPNRRGEAFRVEIRL